MDRVITHEDVDALAVELCAAGPGLRALGIERRARALAAAAAALASPDTSHGQRARELMPASAGLSAEMVDWALRTSLEPITANTLLALASRAHASHRGQPVLPRLVSVLLAGNVFTAALRPMILPLLVGAPVLCKASSRDHAFPQLFLAALRDMDIEVGAAAGVVSFPGDAVPLARALFARSDVAVVYGSDETVQAMRALLPATTRLVEHGHGVSAAYAGASALSSMDIAMAAARALALDTAAYDQRGCLSPHVILARRGCAVSPSALAALVHDALSELEHSLPRGPVPADVGAAQMQWRGVIAVQGELHAGASHAVAYLDSGALRLGPGWRNLLVQGCDGPEDTATRLGGVGVHLKAVGVACDHAERDALVAALPTPLCPRVCPVGRMQTPPLDGFSEGGDELHDLLRWVIVEP